MKSKLEIAVDEHELKTDPLVFEAVNSGAKTHEIRLNDRGFAVGDKLVLRETESCGAHMALGAPLVYTGRTAERTVSHIQTGYGLASGWCILSFAAIQSQPDAAVGGWQPIETAPVDCLLLLAYEFDRPGDWRIKVGGFWNGEWEVFGASWTPTRWMPMVAAPTVSDYEARRFSIRAIKDQGSDAA